MVIGLAWFIDSGVGIFASRTVFAIIMDWLKPVVTTFWKIHTRSLMQHSGHSFNSWFDHPHGPTALPAGSDLIRRIHVLTHPKG
jgi:predicted naringenin-chalcone synthase